MKNNVLAGALVALGLSLAGLFVYCGISKFADKDRAVTVKGLSTREVIYRRSISRSAMYRRK